MVEMGFSPKCQLLRSLYAFSMSIPGMRRAPGHWPRPSIQPGIWENRGVLQAYKLASPPPGSVMQLSLEMCEGRIGWAIFDSMVLCTGMDASPGARDLIGSVVDVMQMPRWSPKWMSFIQVMGRGLAGSQDAPGLKELKSVPSLS